MSAQWVPAWHGAHDVEIQGAGHVIVVKARREVVDMRLQPPTDKARTDALILANLICSAVQEPTR